MLHVYAWGLERMATEVPNVPITVRLGPNGDDLIYRAECELVCNWYEEVVNIESDLTDPIAEHRRWHEEGMPQ